MLIKYPKMDSYYIVLDLIVSRQSADGCRQRVYFGCAHWRPPTRCPYRACYISERNAIFSRLAHDHTKGPLRVLTKKRRKTKRRRLCNWVKNEQPNMKNSDSLAGSERAKATTVAV